MSDVLKRIYNACDPYKPATSEYYYNCGAARGDSLLTQEFLKRLKLTDDYISFLFSGHIGCGKSSELEQLRRMLMHSDPFQSRYFPILLDVSDYLDDYDATPTDILLAIVTEMADALNNTLEVKLKDNYFVKRINEVKEFFLSDVEINEGELPLWGAKLKVQRLKRDPDARKKVRAKLEPKMSTMLEEINTVFDEARLAVKR